MPDRTRPIRKEICLNEQELSMVRHKMNQLGTHNFGALRPQDADRRLHHQGRLHRAKKLAAAVSCVA